MKQITAQEERPLELHEQLDLERRRQGLTLLEVAKRAKLARGTVAVVLRGKTASLDRYSEVAAALGYELELSFNLKRK